MLDRQHACWNKIGVGGAKTCPELPQHVHCRNCPVFAEAARTFLRRPPPSEYSREWARRLDAPLPDEDRAALVLCVFRVAAEWLALPAEVFLEVAPLRRVRPIPGHSNHVLLGLTAVRGAIHLCFSMSALLGLSATPPALSDGRLAGARHCLVRHAGAPWVFQADAVSGLCRFHQSELQPDPDNVARASPRFTRGVLDWEGRAIGVLEPALLWQSLEQVLA
ncbi:MAG: chemotaxis protein CheW [Lentisphaerae bacterium]|nr:chemotaxis protein CheW [Lentisphaerota bacterium]